MKRKTNHRSPAPKTRKPAAARVKQNSQFKLGPFHIIYGDEPLSYKKYTFNVLVLLAVLALVVFIFGIIRSPAITMGGAGITSVGHGILKKFGKRPPD